MAKNDIEDFTLICSLKLNYFDDKGCIIRNVSNPKSAMQLGRNEFRDIILKIECAKMNFSYSIKDIMLHTKFIKEGKATIKLKSPPVQIFISNCPPNKLSLFLKTLMAKVEKLKETKPLGPKQRLLSTKPPSFEEISPLTAKDINILNRRLTNVSATNSAISPDTSISRKRKIEIDQNGNKTPSQKKLIVPRPLVPRLLTTEQQNVMNAVMNGRNIFFTGSAGTGKSFLLKRIIGALAPESTFATASTGVAACQIGGITLHSFAGIGSETTSIEQCIQQVHKKGKAISWKKCQHLIVDEISMVDGNFFQKLEKIARIIKNNDKPFGGIQLILSGDFFQLPPITKYGQNRKFCFESFAWRNCIDINIELSQVKRQTDTDFIKILQSVRKGCCNKEVIDKLKSTSNNNIDKDGIIATNLSTHKDDVEIINNSQLEQLTGKSEIFYAIDSDQSVASFINNYGPVAAKLELKIGAQVMLTKNLDLQRNLVNGARGVVIGFESGKQKLPIVKFASGITQTMNYEKWVFRSPNGATHFRKMLPLKLAWAISIHKSQGMTLDCVEVSLARVFECGQAYVALSRARSIDGLRVLDIEPSNIRADPRVLKFYSQLICSTYMNQTEIDDYL